MTDLYTGGEYLYQLETELFEFGREDDLQLKLEDYKDSYGIDPEGTILSTLALCNAIISYGRIHHRGYDPTFELTERTIEHALHYEKAEPSKDLSLSDYACLEAEPRLLRSLGWHDGPEANRIGSRNNTKPAAIYFDVYGEPCAYQKASGLDTAYVWRTCTVETGIARYRLPADCFISIDYPPAEDPRFFYPEHSLVAFKNMPQQATINLLRFSTFGIDKSLRLGGAHSVMERADKLSDQLPALSRISSYDISDRVQQLLKDGRALSVSHHY